MQKGLVTVALEVDHIKPLSQGGKDERANYQPICLPCHVRKSAEEQGYKAKREIGIDGVPTDGSW